MKTVNIQKGPVTASAKLTTIGNISFQLTYDGFKSGSVQEIAQFIEDQTNNMLTHLLQSYSLVKLNMNVNCDMMREDGEIDHDVHISSRSSKVYRHESSRLNVVHAMLLRLFNPKQYNEEYGDVTLEGDLSGSMFSVIDTVRTVEIAFTTPLEYIANSLSQSYQLIPDSRLNRYIDYIPYNKDMYCFMHCLHLRLDEEMDFDEWFNKHNLKRFYNGQHFLIDMVEEIEEELKCNINIYNRTGFEKIELYFRSNYRYIDHEEQDSNIISIVVMGLRWFRHRKTLKRAAEEYHSIESTKDAAEEGFLSRENFKEFVNNRLAHAVILNPNWFGTLTKDGKASKAKNTSVCRYCTNVCKASALQEHETNCLAYHKGLTSKERVRNFVEVKNVDKEFKAYRAYFQVPFATYDWETRLDESGNHIPYSYAILYNNIFKPHKSGLFLRSNFEDPQQLVQDFIEDCKTLTVHHHDLQSVDIATDKIELTDEIRQAGCPWCKNPYSEKNPPEFQHTHFEGDELNKHLNIYICMLCNRKSQIRNLPLKFMGHNASRYDHNMFMNELLNDPTMMNHEFVNKNESRFSEVRMGFKLNDDDVTYDILKRPIAKYKMSFNDSILLLGGSLSSLTKAWVGKKDTELLKTYLQLYYRPCLPKDENGKRFVPEEFVNQSFKKQVFPYLALSSQEALKSPDELDKKYFHNTFTNTPVDEDDYKEYQQANAILKNVIGERYTFEQYHNYYLLLDVVLLAIILRNFQKICVESTSLNPLSFLSASSYSFNALLHHNKHNTDLPTIKLCSVDVGHFLRSSIHGGFTFIFNRKNLRGEKDYTHYYDFTSLYPTVMSRCKLPYEFARWEDLGDKTVKQLLANAEKNSEEFYQFLEVDIAPLHSKYHDVVSLYPMFPETQTIFEDEYSEDQRLRYKLNTGKELKDQTINTVSFYGKQNYITSWSYLKAALEVGYKVTKIHKIALFKQDYILKDYIDLMYKTKCDLTIEKGKAKDESIKAALASRISIAKLILNAIYGFCLVNVETHSEAQIIDLEEEKSAPKLQKLVSSLRFKSLIKVGERVVVNRMKTSYSYDYPLQIGTAILFESKLLMVKYIYSLQKWLSQISPELEIHPCFTDTDSYCMSIKNFKDHFKSIDEFTYRFNKEVYVVYDTVTNAKEYQMPETHAQLGFLTNEAEGKEITEWVGIACKAYSYKVEGEVVGTKGKGISKALAAQYLNFDLYEGIIDGTILDNYSKDAYSVSFNDFKANKFNVSTVNVKKCFTTLVDLKSYCPENGSVNYIFGSSKHLASL